MKQITRMVRVEESVIKQLHKDRKTFQKLINGGKWSLSDTIREYQKIIDPKVKP